MHMTGNTILITGGGSGIGRALAEAFHRVGNKVIISGRRADVLESVAQANPGMTTMTVDVQDPQALALFAEQITRDHPELNVLINNAGIMKPEDWRAESIDTTTAIQTINTNLLAPIQLTAALLPHLKKQANAHVVTVTSGLAYLTMAATPTYCATKAAIHAFGDALRYQLRETNVKVVEIVPPYVQTELMGAHQASDPNAMPLNDFITEVMSLLGSGSDEHEILVQRVYPLRFAAEQGQEKYQKQFTAFNDAMTAARH